MGSLVKAGLCCLCVLVVVGAVSGLGYLIWYKCFRKESFSETILRRCSKYIRDPKVPVSNKNCTEIEEAFRSAFVSKDPCKITEQDYQPLTKLVNQAIPCDKVIFWSRTKKVAHEYVKKQKEVMITLEDTLLGYIADDLTWCSKPGSSDVKTKSCPLRSDSCRGNVMSVFWDVISQGFAEKACGTVQVILNGSIPNAFNRNSTFARVEAPNFKPGKVSTLLAWVIHNSGGPISDSCSGSSISDLKLILNEKKIAFTCQEKSTDEFLQCVKNPKDPRCRSRG